MKDRDLMSLDCRDTQAVETLYSNLWNDELENCADVQIGYVSALADKWTFSASYRLGSSEKELSLITRLSELAKYRNDGATFADYLYPLRNNKPKAILRHIREELRGKATCANCRADGKSCASWCTCRIEATKYDQMSAPVQLYRLCKDEANLNIVRELVEFYRTVEGSKEKYPVRNLRGKLAMFAASVYADGIPHIPTSCHSLFSEHSVGCAAGQVVHLANPYRAQIAVFAPSKRTLAGVCGGPAYTANKYPKLPIIARFGLCAQIVEGTLYAWADRIYGERNFAGLTGAIERVLTRRGTAIASMLGLSFEFGNPGALVSFRVPTTKYTDAPVNAYHDAGQFVSGYSYSDDDNAMHSFGEDPYSGGRYTCERCDCRVDEDDRYSDENGYDYCSDCYWELYGRCERCDGETGRDDLNYVEIVKENQLVINKDLCDWCLSEHYVYCETCEQYHVKDLGYCPNGCDCEDEEETEEEVTELVAA